MREECLCPRILPAEKVGGSYANVIQTLTVLGAENDTKGGFDQFPDIPQAGLATQVSKPNKTSFPEKCLGVEDTVLN